MSFLSLNTWITKHERKDYIEQQVGGLQKGRLQSAIRFGLVSVTEWVTKCNMDWEVWQDDLQSARGLQKETTQSLPYISLSQYTVYYFNI